MNAQLFKYIISVLLYLFAIQNSNANLIPVKGSDVFMHSDILSVVQDKEGFVWFASFDGLYRYDGNEMKVFKHIDGNQFSLSSNRITSLTIDQKDRIIIGTESSGLCIYDKKNRSV